MEAERIEGLSVLFTAGIASGACLYSLVAHSGIADSLAGIFLLAVCVATIIHKPSLPLVYALWFLGGIYCYVCADLCIRPDGGNTVIDFTHATADKVRTAIRALPFKKEENCALVVALVTGDRSGIGKDTVEIFRESGASHILALSGLHVGIIYSILQRGASILGNSPSVSRTRGIATVLLIWMYSIATGSSPSIIRAALFISLRELAIILGRRRKATTVLFVALFLQLAANPMSIKTIGFQLSYLAMCGIVLVYPRMEAWFPDGEADGLARKIWKGAALGISCQLFTAPLVWVYFKSFPAYFMMTNLLAMPVTTLLIALSVASTILACIGLHPPLLLAINEKTADTLLWILTVISKL